MTLSIMFVIFNLPGIIVALLASTALLPSLFPFLSINSLISAVEGLDMEFTEGITAETVGSLYNVIFMVMLALGFVAFQYFVVGPVQAGLTLIHRNYARGEHSFLWWDFKDGFKDNWKQSLVASLAGTLLCFLIINAYYFYGQAVTGIFGTMIRTLLIILLLLLTIAQMYVYQMMVTFDLPLKHIFKNALLFSILRLPFNIGIVLALLVVNAVIPLAILLFLPDVRALFIIAAYFAFFAFSFSMFLINYFVNRQLMRFMIKPLLAQQAQEEEALEEDWDEEDYEEERVRDERDETEEDEEDEEEADSAHIPGRVPV